MIGPIEAMKDAIGRAYDAAKFLPKFNRNGWWVHRNAGRKPKSAERITFQPKEITPMSESNTAEPPAPETVPVPAPAGTPTQPAAAMPDFSDIEAAAKTPDAPAPAETAAADEEDAISTTSETIIGIIQTALVLIGQDEGVLSDAEKLLLRRPLVRVLEKYDIADDFLPPEVDLAVALASIVIMRLKKPKTATFAVKVKTWFQKKFFARKGRELAKEVEEATK